MFPRVSKIHMHNSLAFDAVILVNRDFNTDNINNQYLVFNCSLKYYEIGPLLDQSESYINWYIY